MKLPVLKLLGGLLLLTSWITQNTFQNYWTGRSAQLQQAELIYLSFLSNSFTIDAMKERNESPVDWNAMNIRVGLEYMTRGLQKRQESHWSTLISNAKDEDINNVGIDLMKEVESEYTKIDSHKALSRWIFFSTYLIGALMITFAELLKVRLERSKIA